MLFAQFIGDPPHPSDIAFLIAPVFPAGFHGYGIPNNVVVDAFGIEMGADHRLKFPAEQPFRKFHSDLMRQFRGNLPGGKTLHQMEPLHTFFLMPHFLDPTHILKGGVYDAADGGLEQILLGFVFVEGFPDFTFQRFLIFPAGTLFLIEGIVDGVVEAVDGDHAGICDGGFLLS